MNKRNSGRPFQAPLIINYLDNVQDKKQHQCDPAKPALIKGRIGCAWFSSKLNEIVGNQSFFYVYKYEIHQHKRHSFPSMGTVRHGRIGCAFSLNIRSIINSVKTCLLWVLKRPFRTVKIVTCARF